jgi:hypothetical protein
MKKLKIEELIKYDAFALTSIIEYWKDYETETVLLSIAELNRREYKLPENILKKQNLFFNNNNISNLEETLKIYFEEKGVNSYKEYFNNKFPNLNYKTKNNGGIRTNSNNNIEYIIANPTNISSAGKSLKAIVYSSLILMGCFFIGLLVAFNTSSAKTLKNTYILIGFASIILNIIILVSLYNAGDNLENSVKISDKEENLEENKINSEQKKPSF